MTKQEQIKNILAFLFIIFSEEHELLQALFKKSPDYLIEKYDRYILSKIPEFDWGMHPNLRRVFDQYCDKWRMNVEHD